MKASAEKKDVDEQRQRAHAIIRRILAGLLAAPFFILASQGRLPMWAVAAAAIGFILLGPDTASFLSHSFDSILWSHRLGGKRPMYGVPESLVQRGRFDEAIAAYEKIIAEYPGEMRPHMGLIEVAIVRLNDRVLAAKFFERSLAQLKDPADQAKLKDIYSAICERWKDPSRQEPHIVGYRSADGPPRGPRASSAEAEGSPDTAERPPEPSP